jgi:hypothetical protein
MKMKMVKKGIILTVALVFLPGNHFRSGSGPAKGSGQGAG